jgi:hypothetical protein
MTKKRRVYKPRPAKGLERLDSGPGRVTTALPGTIMTN